MPNGHNPSGDISLLHEVSNEVAFMHAMRELVAINKHKMTLQTVSDFEDAYAEWEAAQPPAPPSTQSDIGQAPGPGVPTGESGQGESQQEQPDKLLEEDEKPFIPEPGR